MEQSSDMSHINDSMSPNSSSLVIKSQLKCLITSHHLPRLGVDFTPAPVSSFPLEDSKECNCVLIVHNSIENVKKFVIKLSDVGDECDVEKEFVLLHSMMLKVVEDECVDDERDESYKKCISIQNYKDQLHLCFSDGHSSLLKEWNDFLCNALACLLITDACFTRAFRNPEGVTYISLDNLEYSIGKALKYFVTDSNMNVAYGLKLAECKWDVQMAIKEECKDREGILRLLGRVESLHLLRNDRDVIKLKSIYECENSDDISQQKCTAVYSGSPYTPKVSWETLAPGLTSYSSKPYREVDGNGEEENKYHTCDSSTVFHMDSGHSYKPMPYTFPKKSHNVATSISLERHFKSPLLKVNEKHKLQNYVYQSAHTSPLVKILSGVNIGDGEPENKKDSLSTDCESVSAKSSEGSETDTVGIDKNDNCNNNSCEKKYHSTLDEEKIDNGEDNEAIVKCDVEDESCREVESLHLMSLSCSYDVEDDNGDSFRGDNVGVADGGEKLCTNIDTIDEINSEDCSPQIDNFVSKDLNVGDSNNCDHDDVFRPDTILNNLKTKDIFSPQTQSVMHQSTPQKEDSCSVKAMPEVKNPSDQHKFQEFVTPTRSKVSDSISDNSIDLDIANTGDSHSLALATAFSTQLSSDSLLRTDSDAINCQSSGQISDMKLEDSKSSLAQASSASPALTSEQSKRLREIMEKINKSTSGNKVSSGRKAKRMSQPVRHQDVNTCLNVEGDHVKTKKTEVITAREFWGIPSLRITAADSEVIKINPDIPIPIETEYFKGDILIMLNCNDKRLSKYDIYSEHFKGKQRKFEIQIQGMMKTIPDGEIMIGGELPQQLELTFFTKTFLSVLSKFATTINPSAHISFGTKKNLSGMHELPHLMFPLMKIVDKVVVTPPGESAPKLGSEIYESVAHQKSRKSSQERFRFQLDYLYTLSLYSMYVDFPAWKVCGIPGIGEKCLNDFIGKQNLLLVSYAIDEKNLMENGVPVHRHAHKKYLLHLEMKHEMNFSSDELYKADKIIENEGKGDEINENVESLEKNERPPNLRVDVGSAPSPLQVRQAELLMMGQKQHEFYLRKKHEQESKRLFPEDNNKLETVCESGNEEINAKAKHEFMERCENSRHWCRSFSNFCVFVIFLITLLSLSTSVVHRDAESTLKGEFLTGADSDNIHSWQFSTPPFREFRWRQFNVNPIVYIPQHIHNYNNLWSHHKSLFSEFNNVVKQLWIECVRRRESFVDLYRLDSTVQLGVDGDGADETMKSLTIGYNNLFSMSSHVVRGSIEYFIEGFDSLKEVALSFFSKADGEQHNKAMESMSVLPSEAGEQAASAVVKGSGVTSLKNQVQSALSKYGEKVTDHISKATQQVLHGTGKPLRVDFQSDIDHGDNINYDMTKYIGDTNGKDRHGKGIYKWPDGQEYDGDWVNDKRHGTGVHVWPDNFRYEGSWFDDMKSGSGTQVFADGMKYEGDYFQDQRSGAGVYTWPSGESYVGEWKNDRMHGHGVYTYANGNKYEGVFEYGNRVPPNNNQENESSERPHNAASSSGTMPNNDLFKVEVRKTEIRQIRDNVHDVLSRYASQTPEKVASATRKVLHGTGDTLRIDEKEQ